VSSLQILNLGGFLLGGTALAVTVAVLFEGRPALEGSLGLLSKRQVMPLFAVAAAILFIAVTLGACAATKVGGLCSAMLCGSAGYVRAADATGSGERISRLGGSYAYLLPAGRLCHR